MLALKHWFLAICWMSLGTCATVALSGCNPAKDATSIGDIEAPIVAPTREQAHKPPVSIPVQWSDRTKAAGIEFHHNNGAFGLKFMPETLGSGCAFFDYNGDGWPDIFLVNGRDWTRSEVDAYLRGSGREHARKFGFVAPPLKRHTPSRCALYRNNGNGTFTDVSHGSGLDVEIQGMGVTVGDYDNDGKPDLYVTALGHNYLFHNESTPQQPRFRDVTREAAVLDAGWSTSAAWLDYDKDGLLDLFVCHYVAWSPAIDSYRYAGPNSRNKSYSGPTAYGGQFNHLYHNIGGGRFVDVAARAGIQTGTNFSGRINFQIRRYPRAEAQHPKLTSPPPKKLLSKGLGVAITDYDNDGWPDIVVANDTVPIFLYHNNGNGTFSDVATKAGVAAGEAIGARGGMGIDAADVDHSGHESLVVGYYANQLMGLYHNVGDGLFEDKAAYAELGRPGISFVIFGCAFIDINNDGWPDILTVNGHVMDDIQKERPNLTYAQRPLLFLNRQRKDLKFDEIGQYSGTAMGRPIVGRGLACADYDLDGDVDTMITSNDGPAYLMRNEGGNKNNSIRVILRGTKSNRDGIGAVVHVQAGQMTLKRVVRSGSSYLSQSELPLTIGIGLNQQVNALTVDWPSGMHTRLAAVPINSILTINETQGLIRRQRLHL